MHVSLYVSQWYPLHIKVEGGIFNMSNGAVLAFDLILKDVFMIVCELQ